MQRVGENRRSLELRNSRIPRIFRNNLAYEDDTDSQFTCILRNFGLEHGFVHLQRAGKSWPRTCDWEGSVEVSPGVCLDDVAEKRKLVLQTSYLSRTMVPGSIFPGSIFSALICWPDGGKTP